MILTEREQLDRANAEIERLRAALVGLEAMAERYRPPGYPIPDAQKVARAALAQKAEPVAVIRTVGHKGGSFDWFAGLGEECSVGDLLYAAPSALPVAVNTNDERNAL
jgi:hypothetical protein